MNSKFMSLKYLAVFLLAAVFLILVSFDAFSADLNLGSFNGSTKATFVGNVMKTEYRYEYVDSTCSREVPSGSHQVCTEGRTETRCEKVPGVGAVCRDVSTGRSCHSETTYRTEYYSCRERERVSYDVLDYTIDAEVEVVKGAGSEKFDLNQCVLFAHVFSSGEGFGADCNTAIVRQKVLERKGISKSQRRLKIALDFSSIEGLSALKHGLSGLQYNEADGEVTFVTANLKKASNFKLALKIVRNRFLLKDKIVIARTLKPTEYTVDAGENDEYARVTVNLKALGAEFDSTKKHTIQVDLSTLKPVDLSGNIINNGGLKNTLTTSIIVNN